MNNKFTTKIVVSLSSGTPEVQRNLDEQFNEEAKSEGKDALHDTSAVTESVVPHHAPKK